MGVYPNVYDTTFDYVANLSMNGGGQNPKNHVNVVYACLLHLYRVGASIRGVF